MLSMLKNKEHASFSMLCGIPIKTRPTPEDGMGRRSIQTID